MFTLTDKPADEYLTYHGHIADDMVLLTDGSHVVMLRVDGKPLSLMETIARYAERRRRHATHARTGRHQRQDLRASRLPRPGRAVSARADSAPPSPESWPRLSRRHSADLTREWIITIIVHPRPLDGLIQPVLRRRSARPMKR